MMTTDYLADCQREIEAELDEISTHLRFLAAGFKVYAKSGLILGHVSGDAELRPLVTSFKNERLDDLTVFYQSLYAQVWGRFELFMRKLVVAYVRRLSEIKQDFKTLDDHGLIRRNLKNTGIALQHIYENRLTLSTDFYELARNAATSVPESKAVVINAETFSVFMKGPTPEGVKDVFNRLNIDLPSFDKLAAANEVQQALKTSDVRETAKELEAYLKQAAQRRNQIVHRGVKLEAISESDVAQAIEVFSALAKSMLELAKKDCDKKCA